MPGSWTDQSIQRQLSPAQRDASSVINKRQRSCVLLQPMGAALQARAPGLW